MSPSRPDANAFPVISLLPSSPKARRLAFILFALFPVAMGLLALWLGQDANWDLRNYHWYNAYALLNDRLTYDLLPSQTPSFYNPALDVPFFLLATHVPARVAAFVLAGVQGLNFVLLFMLAHAALRLSNPTQKVMACAALAGLGFLGGGGIAQIGVTFYDNITSLGIFASALLVLSHLPLLIAGAEKKAWGASLLFGLPAGIMMGLKLPCVVFCLGLCLALLGVSGSLRRRLGLAFFFGLGVLIGVMISLGPWAWFLWTHYDNPLFPYFNGLFHSPLAPLTSARDVQFIPTSLSDRLFFPFVFAAEPHRVGEIPWRDWRLPALYALLPFGIGLRLLFGRNKNAPDLVAEPLAVRYLLWLAAISYTIWMFLFAIYRYALPLEMLAPLLIVLVIGLLPLKGSIKALMSAAILIVLAATIQPGNWNRLPAWLDKTVEVEREDMLDSPDWMLLMAGFAPYSHVVTLFPQNVPVVRLQSNFTSPEQDKGMNDVIRKRLAMHRDKGGKFLLLIQPYQQADAVRALTAYGYVVMPDSCNPVEDLLSRETLNLCRVIPQTDD